MARRDPQLYVRSSGRYRRPRNSGRTLLAVALALIVLTAVVAAVKYVPELLSRPTGTTVPGQTTATTRKTDSKSTTTAATPTPSPTPTPPPAYANPLFLPETTLAKQSMGSIDPASTPSARSLTSNILNGAGNILSSFNRANPISLLNPLGYQQVPGVLTFRGNNFRNTSSFGTLSTAPAKLTQLWTRPVGSLPSSSWSFSWTGTGWTGQPVMVQWDPEIRQLMNIVPEKKNKDKLVEVISATMDGNIYFYDLEDGKSTREPIKVGAPIKGTPCIDPRGYPVLYVGQGDNNKNVKGIGFRVYNLVDQSLLHFQECSDNNSYRPTWGACDSSPIFDGAADTLIYPNENGMIYTARMNTVFDKTTGKLTVKPEFTNYRYKMPNQALQGIESSLALYDRYGYFSDNSGILHCLDMNTMKPVWSYRLEDDSDVTPVLSQKGSEVAVYTGTEIDWQKNIIGNYQGDAFVYKFDALTGKVLWKTSYKGWTKNAANVGDDINGGVMGTPIVGKKKIGDLVIYNFCMTTGIYSGSSVVAFNQADGKMVWEYKMNAYSWSSPVDVYDKDGNAYIVLPDSAGQLHLINGQTGQKITVLELKKADGKTGAGNIESSCAVFGDNLVVGTRGNVIVGVRIG